MVPGNDSASSCCSSTDLQQNKETLRLEIGTMLDQDKVRLRMPSVLKMHENQACTGVALNVHVDMNGGVDSITANSLCPFSSDNCSMTEWRPWDMA